MGTPGTDHDVDLDSCSGNPNDATDPPPGGWRPNGNDVRAYWNDIHHGLYSFPHLTR
jgi:hypothetical protein